ncbi:hypothetical protein GQ43DRAFT_209329 [Delitschia confertaspora ATCC 74209]|uniref:Uncharacterized protein n=1 Tax=Delitschia confertaspora ATCC 74209 TaxID=1513339 RepID=A0A9P4MLQ2_9PLEO|nr:hypothetical protein GQ43DRAFT_209329 [Delitschia confertaspora ATCC 74209]
MPNHLPDMSGSSNEDSQSYKDKAYEMYNQQYEKWMPWMEDQYLKWFTKDNKASYTAKGGLTFHLYCHSAALRFPLFMSPPFFPAQSFHRMLTPPLLHHSSYITPATSLLFHHSCYTISAPPLLSTPPQSCPFLHPFPLYSISLSISSLVLN